MTNEKSVGKISAVARTRGAMRHLIVVPSLTRAGAETQAVDLANGLAAAGHSIHLCSFERHLDQRRRLSEDVTFHHVQRQTKMDRSVVSRLATIIDSERIDVVQGVLQIAILVAWLAARRSATKPPVVAAIHTTINRGWKDELYDRFLYRRILRRTSAVVFVCNHQRDHWIRKYPELESKSTVVYNGVAKERFRRHDFAAAGHKLRAELNIPKDAILFSSIAAFRPEKGHRLLIDAFSRIQGEHYLVFAGDGDLRANMQAFVEEVGLKERTRFLGNIPDSRPLIVASNATVLASTAVETFSMAMLESMALGVPMVAPHIGGLPEAIIHGETGLLFPIGDISALASCMQSVVQQPSTVTRMGQAAERKVADSFTFDKMIAGTEHVLTEAFLTR